MKFSLSPCSCTQKFCFAVVSLLRIPYSLVVKFALKVGASKVRDVAIKSSLFYRTRSCQVFESCLFCGGFNFQQLTSRDSKYASALRRCTLRQASALIAGAVSSLSPVIIVQVAENKLADDSAVKSPQELIWCLF